MLMKRQLLIIMTGSLAAFAGLAQEFNRPLQMDPVITNHAVANPGGGLMLPTGPQDSAAQPVHILPDDSRSPEDDAEAGTTNDVRMTKATFLMSTGVEYADEGEFEEAERAYLRALTLDPDNEQTLMRLGSLYVKMEKFKEAVDAFGKLLEINPEDPLAHNNLAWCYAIGPEVRNVSLALRHSRDALLFAPNMPSVWNTLAESYYVSGNYDKALRSAEQALALLQRVQGVDEESIRSFEEQISKIKRAEEASELLTNGFLRGGRE
jgi:Flp pilus assembly protein TadD